MSDETLLSNKERKRPNVSSKSLLNLKSIITQNVTLNENKCSSFQPNDDFDEIKNKKRKKSQTYPNSNVLIEYLTKPDLKQLSTRRIITSNDQIEQSNIQSPSKRIVIPRTLTNEKEQINNNRIISRSDTRVVIPKEDEQHSSESSMNSNDKEPTIIPLSSFDSSVPSLLSFSALSSNSINQEYITQVHHILSSWNNHENELKSTIDSDKTISMINKCSKIEFSTNRKVVNSSPIRRQYPQFESVPTPIQQSQSFIPSELFDCCESNQHEQSTSNETNSDYLNSFHTSVLLRETMINISKRLTKVKSLSLVDTHCHFDLIFDRLYIKHNNLKKYFDDYKDLYPSGLSFELAIHVFWRPRHLSEKNWINWYSKYLNDERVYGSCGIHPHWSSSWSETTIQDIERCLEHPKIVAIGEIGLDFGRKNTCNIDQQSRVFEEQLKLAVKWLKPIVIHSRDAYKQTFDIMKKNLESNHKIHLHCFVGTINDVHLFTSYFNNIKFGFTPIISRTNFLHTVIQQLDLTQILSETDSPYFVPEELSNLSRCAHPGMVYSVIEIIAQIRQLSIDDVAFQLRENAYDIYGV